MANNYMIMHAIHMIPGILKTATLFIHKMSVQATDTRYSLNHGGVLQLAS